MDDDPDTMLRQSLIISACFWLVILSLVFLSGCTPTVKHEVPQLDTAASAIKKIVVEGCQKPTLAMPPIPENCIIDIRGATMTASSKECEDLVRFYVRARQLLKPAAQPSTKPTTAQ